MNWLGALIVLALSGGQREPTLFQTLVPHPTGANAYEDYVRAADIVRGPEFYALISQLPNKDIKQPGSPLSGREGEDERFRRDKNNGVDYVTTGRLLVDRFGGALEAIRVGNGKPFTPPPPADDQMSSPPILSRYRMIAKLSASAAYYQFAIGESGKATNTLLDLITFSHRISQGSEMDFLVGIACISIANASFNECLGSICDEDAIHIIRYTEEALAEPMGLDRVVENERVLTMRSLEQMLSKVTAPLENDPSLSPASPLVIAMKKWGPAEKDRYRRAYLRSTNGQFQSLILVAKADEAHLLSQLPLTVENAGDEAATRAIDAGPESFGEFMARDTSPNGLFLLSTALRNRAQLRLLGLHARIIDFRWKNKRLPNKLEECAPASAFMDPLSGKPFVYEPGNGVYELYSKGSKGTGRVDLKYRGSRGVEAGS